MSHWRTQLSVKLKKIFLPFLLINVGTILSYGLFRWVFDVKLGILQIDVEILDFWMSILLSWVPILLWIRPRLKVLKHRKRSRLDNYWTIQRFMSLVIFLPLLNSQEYIVQAGYDLIEVDSVEQMSDFPNEKYFRLNNFILDTDHSVSYTVARTSGRANQYLDYNSYTAIPFKGVDHTFLGFFYAESFSNRLSDHEKNTLYRGFLNNADQALSTSSFYTAQYFERVLNSRELKGYLNALETTATKTQVNQSIILKPVYKSFEQRYGNKVDWILGTFAAGLLFIFILLMFYPVKPFE